MTNGAPHNLLRKGRNRRILKPDLCDNYLDTHRDAHGEVLVQFGIRYYPEKKFEPRIHWLSDQDVPLARRAVERLKLLTTPAREVARWQEANPGRLWSFSSTADIHEDELLKFLSFANHRNLYLYLKNSLGVLPSKEERGDGPRRVRYYRAGEIENALLPKLGDHAVLKKNMLGTKKAILSTSETLSIRFDGAFRFVRAANVIRVFPRAVTVVEINGALGADPTRQSIFDRRNLFEADGSRIQLTSHQPRHWRNTLYDLAGMSNVQQALALGRVIPPQKERV